MRHLAQIVFKVTAFTLGGFRLEEVKRQNRSHFFRRGTGDELVHRNVVACSQFLDLLVHRVGQTNGQCSHGQFLNSFKKSAGVMACTFSSGTRRKSFTLWVTMY